MNLRRLSVLTGGDRWVLGEVDPWMGVMAEAGNHRQLVQQAAEFGVNLVSGLDFVRAETPKVPLSVHARILPIRRDFPPDLVLLIAKPGLRRRCVLIGAWDDGREALARLASAGPAYAEAVAGLETTTHLLVTFCRAFAHAITVAALQWGKHRDAK